MELQSSWASSPREPEIVSDATVFASSPGYATPKISPAERDDARKFCRLIAGDGPLTFEGYFQKFDPRSTDRAQKSKRITGTFDEVFPELEDWEAEGRSVYVRVNEGGSKKAEITGIRVLSIEFDADEGHHAAHQEVPEKWHLDPSIIVQRGQSVHAHWRLTDCTVDEFEDLQRRTQRHYGSDPNSVGCQRI